MNQVTVCFLYLEEQADFIIFSIILFFQYLFITVTIFEKFVPRGRMNGTSYFI